MTYISKETDMASQAVRMQEKGQVTIPLEIRKKLGLKKGDLVTFVETESGVLIKPAEIIVSEALDEIGEALREKGISLEELIERGRGIRGDIIEEKFDIDTKSPGE
jgi:antitoxin PrlF